jgi:hypothetical protein
VTETWCNKHITDAFWVILGYELINDLRKDRYDTDRGRGGGLLVYAKNNISVCVLPSNEPDAKHQYCKFKVKDVVIYLIYSGADSISGMAVAVRRCEKNCVFLGDFNVPDIDWEAGSTSRRADELLQAAEDGLLEQLVQFTTHVQGNILDLILINTPERVADVQDEGRLGGSDHVMISCKIVTKAGPQPEYRARPDWNKADWPAIKQELSRDDWKARLQGLNTKTAWDLLKNRLHALTAAQKPQQAALAHQGGPA